LRQVYEDASPSASFADFVAALTVVLQEQWAQREFELREVSCVTRFTRTLVRAGLPNSKRTKELAQKLSRAHNAALAKATHIPPEIATFLGRAASKYQLALVSNFDDAPTARQMLQDAGVADHFDCVMISDEHGWRKPDPRIFADTLRKLEIRPDEALFVGEAPKEDVGGAKDAGMDVAWINPLRLPLPKNVPMPDYDVVSLVALQPFLFD
jgi:putative hydrolase of the HAD superfamily